MFIWCLLFSLTFYMFWCHLLRMILTESNFFGNDPSFQKRFDVAYRHFKSYIATKKIPCSQAPFTEKMVTRKHFIWASVKGDSLPNFNLNTPGKFCIVLYAICFCSGCQICFLSFWIYLPSFDCTACRWWNLEVRFSSHWKATTVGWWWNGSPIAWVLL